MPYYRWQPRPPEPRAVARVADQTSLWVSLVMLGFLITLAVIVAVVALQSVGYLAWLLKQQHD